MDIMDILRNTELSLKAKGLYCILSNISLQNMSQRKLTGMSKDKATSTASAVHELEKVHLLTCTRNRDGSEKWTLRRSRSNSTSGFNNSRLNKVDRDKFGLILEFLEDNHVINGRTPKRKILRVKRVVLNDPYVLHDMFYSMGVFLDVSSIINQRQLIKTYLRKSKKSYDVLFLNHELRIFEHSTPLQIFSPLGFLLGVIKQGNTKHQFNTKESLISELIGPKARAISNINFQAIPHDRLFAHLIHLEKRRYYMSHEF